MAVFQKCTSLLSESSSAWSMTLTFSGSKAIYCYVTYSKLLPTLMELTSERVKDVYGHRVASSTSAILI